MSERPPERVVIRGVKPELECGRFPVKRVLGETVAVEADIFSYEHDALECVVRYRHEDDELWTEISMEALGNDHWRAQFPVDKLGQYIYTITAWIDPFRTWYQDLLTRIRADQDVTVDLQIGAELLKAAGERAMGADARKLQHAARHLRIEDVDDRLAALASRYAERSRASHYRELRVTVDPIRARFSTWYEMFPRSCGTFKDCERIIPEVAEMGFDVLYFPPIHPIGRTHRKGKNNSREAEPGEPGSPWAIGSKEGGHKAVHPELGTLDDFRRFVAAAKSLGLEVALDLAYQCSPDHPYVREHPEWFRWRPDGTVQYAENPPKKYEDIYPFEFDTPHWRSLWEELKRVVCFWIEQGVRIFRVDNPHTKPLRFWEWLLGEIRGTDADVLFLAEAFTRPAMMHTLAKIGFHQSYTYFTWRNGAQELEEYMLELSGDAAAYMRPNFFTNTPDILNEYLQHGGVPAFKIRAVLAAMLSPTWGIYSGYELCENVPIRPGSEEYMDSEKYQYRPRDWEAAARDGIGIADYITELNRIRRTHPALHQLRNLRFHAV